MTALINYWGLPVGTRASREITGAPTNMALNGNTGSTGKLLAPQGTHSQGNYCNSRELLYSQEITGTCSSRAPMGNLMGSDGYLLGSNYWACREHGPLMGTALWNTCSLREHISELHGPTGTHGP